MGTIKSFKKFIEESIWSDIQDRSAGDTVRKEDDINTLDLNDFYAYIKDQYKTKVEYIDLDAMGGENGDVLSVDITENVILFYKPKRGHILLSWSRVKIPMPFFDELIDRFKVENPHAMRKIITEKDGSCTNKTFVDVIDFFLGHKETIMNESIWSDIQDRSAGDTVRKEDERQKILERLLATYIKLFAESCYYHDEYACSYPDFRSYIKDFRDNPRIEEVCPNDSYFDDLLDYVNKETWDNQIFDTVMEISHRIVKGEHPITDDVTEELKKHNVNESIWSDIQDRSSGDTVRKEDEYDIDEDELERNVDHCIKTYVISSVYYDKYDGSSDTFLKCIQEWDRSICGNPHLYDRRFGKYVESIKVIPSYIKKNWETGKSYKSLVDKKISEEEKKVKDTGFIKKPGESISDTLSKWFDENMEKLGDDFCEEIEEYNEKYHYEGGLRSVDLGVEDWWDHLKYIEQVEIYQEYIKKTNESIWSDIQDRSSGEVVRKEDEMTQDDFIMLRATAKMFRVGVRNYSNPKKRKHTLKRIDGCDGFIYYILEKKKEHFWNDTPDEAYDKAIKFVKNNWGDCTGIQEFIDKCLNNINECDGVPGGLTPADVGGMGPAYFPGPNGEPGSGDLPSPTGIVYKQVAPFDAFIKIRKQKKKKKKKFRIEDEPCAHSKNPKIYDHVDDFRDYVDRVYSNIDKRK